MSPLVRSCIYSFFELSCPNTFSNSFQGRLETQTLTCGRCFKTSTRPMISSDLPSYSSNPPIKRHNLTFDTSIGMEIRWKAEMRYGILLNKVSHPWTGFARSLDPYARQSSGV